MSAKHVLKDRFLHLNAYLLHMAVVNLILQHFFNIQNSILILKNDFLILEIDFLIFNYDSLILENHFVTFKM